MIKRAIIAGLVSTGVNVADLRVAPPAVNRHELKVGERAGGLHVRVSADDPEVVQISFFEPPGILVAGAALKAIEQAFSRQEFRRVSPGEIGALTYPARATESYVQELLGALDLEAIRSRGFRLVLNYACSAASLVVPSLIGELGVEMVSLNAFVDSSPTPRADRHRARRWTTRANLVRAVGADLGVLIDGPAERLWLVDEHEPPDPARDAAAAVRARAGRDERRRASCSCRSPSRGMVEEIADGHAAASSAPRPRCGACSRRRPPGDVSSPGASGGGYVFPEFLPAYDAVMSTRQVLELLAHSGAAAVRARPRAAPQHARPRARAVPVVGQGLAMRQLIEAVKGMEVDDRDGIKVFEPEGWVQMLPDPDEPVFHVYAEGATTEDSQRLEEKYRELLETFVSPTA